MKRSILLVTLCVLLLLSLMAVLAATDSETPNDPRVNPDANACYTGGSMAGKCKLDDALWIAGWYAIRFDYGLISRDQISDQFKWILPPVGNTTEEAQTLRFLEVRQHRLRVANLFADLDARESKLAVHPTRASRDLAAIALPRCTCVARLRLQLRLRLRTCLR